MKTEKLTRRKFFSNVIGTTGLMIAPVMLTCLLPDPATAPPERACRFDIRDFGAVGDGSTLDTKAIQAAIDKCSATGGGTVLVPSGTFLTGTLFMKSNVDLHLSPTATILGSTKLSDYRTGIAGVGLLSHAYIDKCLIYAGEVENIAITGRGTIDGQGDAFKGMVTRKEGTERPMLTRCYRSRNIHFDGVMLKNAGSWCSHFRECTDVRVTNVTIHNGRLNWNNDGIDLMSTSKVHISDCTIIYGDDAICLQNFSDDYPVEDIVITNCIISTRWAAIRSGGSHRGGIRNVTVSNCVIRETYGCGIKLQVSGNGSMENITFSNIVMADVSCPISLRFGNHHFDNGKLDESYPWGTMRNIMFSNIWASVVDEATLRRALVPDGISAGEERQCMSICGIPGHPVEGITLSDIHFISPGGGTLKDSANMDSPEREDDYPEYFMWGVLPAYGLYARHAKGLTLNNVRFELRHKDMRPAVVCDDVEDLDISGLKAAISKEAGSVIRLRATREGFIHGCRPLNEIPLFIRVEGDKCRDISLAANDLRKAKEAIVEKGDSSE